MEPNLTTALETELQKLHLELADIEKRIAAVHTLTPKGSVLRTTNKSGKYAFTDHVVLDDPFADDEKPEEKEAEPENGYTLVQRVVRLLDEVGGMGMAEIKRALKGYKPKSVETTVYSLTRKKILKSKGTNGSRIWRLAR